MIPEHQKNHITMTPEERTETIGELIDWLLEKHLFADLNDEWCILIVQHYTERFFLELSPQEALQIGHYIKKMQALKKEKKRF